MFKLLAIRPLEGCAPHIQKCLKTGLMYYFCNDYIIEPGSHIRRRSKNIKPLKEDFFTVVTESYNADESSSREETPTVSVSAIVGMNGDGKSTLVELMMRLINNCAVSYKLSASTDSLRRVKEVKAELYYMVDNVVYRMAEEEEEDTWIWKMAELDDKNGELMRWEMKPKKIEHVDEDPNCFFFTIVSNYSHYAYNIYDFREEWDTQEGDKDDDEKCWLHYIFHKNDGYLTPITLHPYRYKGNIDINIEKDLSKQRLLSLFLNADKPTDEKPTFRRVNGKDADVLKLTEEKESKLQQKAIIGFFKSTTNQGNRYKILLDEISKVDEEIDQENMCNVSDVFSFRNCKTLAEKYLHLFFVDPIEQIVNQDGFSGFASTIVNWLKEFNYPIINNTGDTKSVVKCYDTLIEKVNQYANIIRNNRIGETYLAKNDYSKALEYYESAMAMCDSKLVKNHSLTFMTYNNVAEWCYEKGDFNKTLDCYNHLLTIKEYNLGDSDLAIIYNNIAKTYFVMGDYDKSLDYCNRLLKTRQSKLGEGHPDMVMIYNNIAGVYREKGNYKEALDYYDMVLKITENNKNQAASVITYNNIGYVYKLMGNYDIALEYFTRVLLERKFRNGKNAMETVVAYCNMAGVYKSKGDMDNTLRYYKNALNESVSDEINPYTAIIYNNIAWVYHYMKDYFNALLDFENTAKTVSSSEIIFVSKALKNQARGFFELALKDYLKALGHAEKQPLAIIVHNCIAEIYEVEGKNDKALVYYQRAIEESESILGKDHPFSVLIYNHLAEVNEKIGVNDKALEYYSKAKLVLLPWASNTQTIEQSGRNVNDNMEGNIDARGVEELFLRKKREMDKALSSYKRLFNTNNKFLYSIDATQLGRLDTLFRIMKSYDIDWKIVTKDYSELSLKEKCQHYIIYKTWSVLSTYPQYQKAFQKDDVNSIRECGAELEACIEEIKNDKQTHITRKLRQVENFMDEMKDDKGLYDSLGKRDKKNNLLVEIDKLKEHYGGKPIPLDNLPPPIYKWDIVFQKKDDANCEIEYDSFSSGEKQLYNSIGAIIYHLQNLVNTSSGVKYDNVNLVMEEIELYYHPEFQRLFLIRLLDSIRRAKLGNMKNINIVFVTHSPFILSDIPKCNVLFLKDGMPKDIMQENTFGANIHTLLKNGFFMPNLPIGEFAYGKINALFNKLNTGEFNNDDEEKRKKELNDIYQQILLVGEPFLRNQLLMLYNAFKGSSVVPMRTNEKGTES